MNITLYKNDVPDNFVIDGDLAIDTEAMGLQIHRDRLCVIQISNGDGRVYLVHFDGYDYSAPNLRKVLKNNACQMIFHYARFDIAIIRKYLDIKISNIFCTKIASKLVRTYTEYHGLKDLCRELLDISISKQQQFSYWGADSLSQSQKEYAAQDVLYLHSLRDILKNRLFDLKRDKIANKLFSFLPTRAELDLIGWSDIDIYAHHG